MAAAATTSAEPKQVSETAEGREIMADLVAAMKLAIEKNDRGKIVELLAQIRCRAADPENPAFYPENKIKGFVVAAIYNKKIKIAETLYNDLPPEIQEKYWQPRPENILELQCAVANLERWKIIVGSPHIVVEKDPLWIKMIRDRNRHQLDVEESLRSVVESLRHQNKGWEAFDLLLQFSTESHLRKLNVAEIFCRTRWAERETTGPEPDKTVHRELLRWMEKAKCAPLGDLPDCGLQRSFNSFADCAPNLFMGCVITLMERFTRAHVGPEYSYGWGKKLPKKLLSIVREQGDHFQQQLKEICGDLFVRFEEQMEKSPFAPA